MRPSTCDHAACDARAKVFTTFATGQLTFCCHHWGALQTALSSRSTDIRVESTCRSDLVRPTDDPIADGDWAALAA